MVFIWSHQLLLIFLNIIEIANRIVSFSVFSIHFQPRTAVLDHYAILQTTALNGFQYWEVFGWWPPIEIVVQFNFEVQLHWIFAIALFKMGHPYLKAQMKLSVLNMMFMSLGLFQHWKLMASSRSRTFLAYNQVRMGPFELNSMILDTYSLNMAKGTWSKWAGMPDFEGCLSLIRQAQLEGER